MKIIKTLFKVIVISFILILFNINIVFAEGTTLTDIESQSKEFINRGQTAAEGKLNGVTETVTENFVGLGQILTFIGVGVLIATTTYLGIQYFMSPPDKQAELKEKLIALVIATIVIIGAYNIWKMVLTIAQNLDG